MPVKPRISPKLATNVPREQNAERQEPNPAPRQERSRATGSAPTSQGRNHRKLMQVKHTTPITPTAKVPILDLAKALDLTPNSNDLDGQTRYTGLNPFHPREDGEKSLVLNPDGTAFDLLSQHTYLREQVALKAIELRDQRTPKQGTRDEKSALYKDAGHSSLLWLAPTEVSLLLWALIQGATPPSVINLDPEAIGGRGAPARLVFDAAIALYKLDMPLTVQCVALAIDVLADDEENPDVAELMRDTAQYIKTGGLDYYDGKRDKKQPIYELADKLARDLQPKEPQRTRRDEPTAIEIADTAESIMGDGTEHDTFPNHRADQIPKAAILTGEKPEYDPNQLRTLLYPDWKVISLETEAAHAARATEHLGKDILYCPELGFLHFNADTGFWRRDDKDATLTASKLSALAPRVRGEVAALLRYAATLAAAARDSDARAMSRAANSLLTHCKNIEKQSFLHGAAKFVAANVRADVSQFSPVPWRFAFKNRVFDRGAWRSPRRSDHLLQTSPVEYDRKADMSEWHPLLERMTGNNAHVARTLQDACAYAISGASSLRILLWLYGAKGTGKSTICELLGTLLHESATTIDTALLQDSSSRERLGAALWNKRAAFVAEAGNKRIDAELLKALSGGDRLSVRFLYKETFTAPPSHALILAANDAPRTDAYDEALKDRVLALPFTHPLNDGDRLTFAGHKRLESARQDPNSALLRGFAAWVGEGLQSLYRTQEIYKAPEVVAATEQFWRETDPLTEFWETVEVESLKRGMDKSSLVALYTAWCAAENQKPFNRIQWARACIAHGLAEGRRSDAARTPIWTLY